MDLDKDGFFGVFSVTGIVGAVFLAIGSAIVIYASIGKPNKGQS